MGSEGCVLSLAAESMAGGAGAEVGMRAKVQVRAGRVGAPLSCCVHLGPSEKEKVPAPSGNEGGGRDGEAPEMPLSMRFPGFAPQM